jgi:hypothetical protein
MRGIREAAMSQEEEEIKPFWPKKEYSDPWKEKPYSSKNYFKDEFNPTQEEIERDEKELYGYKEKKEGQIDITIAVKYTELNYEDIKGLEYSFETEAIEVAYDKLKTLFNKDFESKYHATYSTEEEYDAINVIVTLIPIKKA